MITGEDIEGMKYFDPVSTYSEWVESMMLTKGKDRLIENTLGLVGEAGEVAEKVKKIIRDASKFNNEEIAKELGDVLFYTVALGNIYGYTLQELIELNTEKLNSRKARGTLSGSGDNR
jgi:NTP pyrophosphatase (non-canonical NTP hydrolase)